MFLKTTLKNNKKIKNVIIYYFKTTFFLKIRRNKKWSNKVNIPVANKLVYKLNSINYYFVKKYFSNFIIKLIIKNSKIVNNKLYKTISIKFICKIQNIKVIIDSIILFMINKIAQLSKNSWNIFLIIKLKLVIKINIFILFLNNSFV